MPARSMINQQLLLKLESTPGTANVTAMNKVLGIWGTPSWQIEGEDFKGSGYKVNTSRITNQESGAVSIETLQDYNAMTWTLCGGFGKPTTTTPATAVTARLHTYTLSASAADPLATFTGMWGDSDRAIQMVYMVFQSLGLTVNRGGLSLESSAIARAPVTGVPMPTTGIVTIPSVPIAARSWDVYADDTWAALGTTKLLALYEGGLTFGDKYTPDFTVNSAVPSFNELLEAEDTEYSGSFRVGFDATADALITTFKNGALKFFRFESIGPIIELALPYKVTLDVCVRIMNPGEVGSAPNSPARTLPFDFGITVDPVTGNSAKAVVQNTVAAL